MTSAYVIVRGTHFWFEPWCGEFKADEPGCVVVLLSDDPARDRGLEVELGDNGVVVLWTPTYSRVFWCPDDDPAGPWVTRLHEIEYY
jgi:hypothetical protein